MNRNSIKEISELSDILASLNKPEMIQNFFTELFTKSELDTLSKRWCIIKMLKNGETQRDIAKELRVSLCKVTRGSQILKKRKSIVGQILAEKKKTSDLF